MHSNNSGSRQGTSIASSIKGPSSIGSSQGKPKSYTSSRSGGSGLSGNLVRQNLLKKTSEMSYNRNKNSLMKTSPNINMTSGSPNVTRKTNEYRPPVRPVVSSHQTTKNIPTHNNNYVRPGYRSPARSDKSSVRSVQSVEIKRKEFTPEEKEKQRAAMARLAGNNHKQPVNSYSKDKNPLSKDSHSLNKGS